MRHPHGRQEASRADALGGMIHVFREQSASCGGFPAPALHGRYNLPHASIGEFRRHTSWEGGRPSSARCLSEAQKGGVGPFCCRVAGMSSGGRYIGQRLLELTMPHVRPQRPATASPLVTKLRNERPRLVPSRFWWPVVLVLAVVALQAESAQAAKPGEARAVATPASVQKLVNAMRKELDLTHAVTVKVVDHNPLKASVEPVKTVSRRADAIVRLSISSGEFSRSCRRRSRAVIATSGPGGSKPHHPYCIRGSPTPCQRLCRATTSSRSTARCGQRQARPAPCRDSPRNRPRPASGLRDSSPRFRTWSGRGPRARFSRD